MSAPEPDLPEDNALTPPPAATKRTKPALSPDEIRHAVSEGNDAARRMESAPPRIPPHSVESEEQLLSGCLLDGADVLARCELAGLTERSFYIAANAIIFSVLMRLWRRGEPTDLAVVAEDLKKDGQLDAVGGYRYLTQVSASLPTTAQAAFFIQRVRELAVLRDVIASATSAVEAAYSHSGELDDFLGDIRGRFDRLGIHEPTIKPRSITSFQIPPDDDASVLLGDRYLNRGDGAVLASTSGMGKSSMTLQLAVLWALARPAFGIRPNGALRSLIIQAEDSDGDIAEVWASISHVLKLTAEEVALVKERVTIVTDRRRRGAAFIARLRSLVASSKPDLVWINPLLAFIDGDINDAHDAGQFLREGLNGLNEPPAFGYIVVHHTAKPPAEKRERKWSEVMYEMAGSAELTNWARAVLSLRASDTEGKFKLVLAKRGRRAGVTKKVEQGAGFRDEVVTTIGLQHATEKLEVQGRAKSVPLIFWEEREFTQEARSNTEGRSGRPKGYTFADIAAAFPSDPKLALGIRALHRNAKGIKPSIGGRAIERLIDESLEQGLIVKDESDPTKPRYYRRA